MKWSTGLSWLTQLTGRRSPRAHEPDAGDMGTAFGLDASIMPSDFESSDGFSNDDLTTDAAKQRGLGTDRRSRL